MPAPSAKIATLVVKRKLEPQHRGLTRASGGRSPRLKTYAGRKDLGADRMSIRNGDVDLEPVLDDRLGPPNAAPMPPSTAMVSRSFSASPTPLAGLYLPATASRR